VLAAYNSPVVSHHVTATNLHVTSAFK